MKALARRALVLIGIITGLFFIAFFAVLIFSGAVKGSVAGKSLIIAGVVTGVYLPVLIWLYVQSISLKRYSGITLEEMELDEEVLSEAVANWIYINHKKRMEGSARFYEDRANNVKCRVTIQSE